MEHSQRTVGPNQITWAPQRGDTWACVLTDNCWAKRVWWVSHPVEALNGWTASDLRKVKPGVLLNTKFLRIKKNYTFMWSPPDWLLFDTVTLEDAESWSFTGPHLRNYTCTRPKFEFSSNLFVFPHKIKLSFWALLGEQIMSVISMYRWIELWLIWLLKLMPLANQWLRVS